MRRRTLPSLVLPPLAFLTLAVAPAPAQEPPPVVTPPAQVRTGAQDAAARLGRPISNAEIADANARTSSRTFAGGRAPTKSVSRDFSTLVRASTFRLTTTNTRARLGSPEGCLTRNRPQCGRHRALPGGDPIRPPFGIL